MLKITKWRRTILKDAFGEVISEGFVPEIGWCRYSQRLGAVEINGKWINY